ncbi:MAG: Rid family hydrolase [Solirubrobacteraceae bacterium]
MTELVPVSTVNAPAPKGHYSQGMRARGFAFVTGQTGTLPDTGRLVSDEVADQAGQALANVQAILVAMDSSLDQAVRVGLLLTSIDDLSAVNAVYAETLGDHRPPRVTMHVAGLPGGALVGFDVTALCAEAPDAQA